MTRVTHVFLLKRQGLDEFMRAFGIKSSGLMGRIMVKGDAT
jgi:hypothetical protein